MLRPGAKSREDSAPGERQRDHDPQPIVSYRAAALLKTEDGDGHGQPQPDKGVMGKIRATP